jgi:hypothetical protein
VKVTMSPSLTCAGAVTLTGYGQGEAAMAGISMVRGR